MKTTSALGYCLALCILAATPSANAHIRVIAPNGGEQIQAGSVYTIQWTIVIAHDLQNWDIWYSTTGPNGPWIDIAMDLPPGDGSVGSKHTYQWTVPETLSEQVRVRVRMDNTGTDYFDVSDGDLAIVSGITLRQSALTRGEQASFLVTGAEPGEIAHFLYSLSGVGIGPRIMVLGDLQLDLLTPIVVIGTARADAMGRALLQVNVPPDVPLVDLVWTQAVIRRGEAGGSSIKTNWNESVIN